MVISKVLFNKRSGNNLKKHLIMDITRCQCESYYRQGFINSYVMLCLHIKNLILIFFDERFIERISAINIRRMKNRRLYLLL